MKTVSAVLFSIVFIAGASLGYVLKGLDSPTPLPLRLTFYSSDGSSLTVPISMEQAQIFLQPNKAVITNIIVRGITEP